MDRAIGRILTAIDESGEAQNTQVWFMSDNGGRGTVPGGVRQALPPNAPLSGAKHSLLEGGIRVPFMVRGPAVAAGSVCHVPVSGYDLLPTFFELAGGKGELSDELDGGSFVSLFSKPSQDRITRRPGALIFHRPKRSTSAVRQGDYKLLATLGQDGAVSSTQLFNVRADHVEHENLALVMPDRERQLRSLLLEYLAEVRDPSANIRKREKK